MQDFFDNRAVKTTNIMVEVVATIGLLGLMLAMVGLYALVAYSVSRRSREIGIRMAIGADRRGVLRMVLREGLALGSIGAGVGLIFSFFACRALSAGLWILAGRLNYAMLPAVAIPLLLVTLLAAYVPARRASLIDRMWALRDEQLALKSAWATCKPEYQLGGTRDGLRRGLRLLWSWVLSKVRYCLFAIFYLGFFALNAADNGAANEPSAAHSTGKARPNLTLTRNTPHFGNDGSLLTSYVPGKSIFVRSVFGSLTPNFSRYAAAFRAAQINTLESGFYVPPNNGGYNYTSSSRWESDFNGFLAPAIQAAANDGFNIILTGDEIARGSDAVYDSVSGPSTLWSEDPITYAFAWAKNVGKVIGVEMVDEISSQFAVPFPEGQLGQPGGPQKITCLDDLCSVFLAVAAGSTEWRVRIPDYRRHE